MLYVIQLATAMSLSDYVNSICGGPECPEHYSPGHLYNVSGDLELENIHDLIISDSTGLSLGLTNGTNITLINIDQTAAYAINVKGLHMSNVSFVGITNLTDDSCYPGLSIGGSSQIDLEGQFMGGNATQACNGIEVVDSQDLRFVGSALSGYGLNGWGFVVFNCSNFDLSGQMIGNGNGQSVGLIAYQSSNFTIED